MPALDSRERILAHLQDLEAMPAVYRRLLEILDEPYPSARLLAEVLSSDLALSVRVLRMVNSAYYGLLVPVASVTRAVGLLGLDVVRSVVLCLASYDVFFTGTAPRQDRLWRHALGTAVLARELARPLGRGVREEAFSAGLMHDVGLAVLARQFPRLWRRYEEDGGGREAEEGLFGADHCLVGQWACERWRLPEVIRDCARWHHEPLLAGENGALVALVHLAQAGWEDASYQGAPEIFEAAGLPPDALEEARSSAETEFERLQGALSGGVK